MLSLEPMIEWGINMRLAVTFVAASRADSA
jgi:hypothetical protein